MQASTDLFTEPELKDLKKTGGNSVCNSITIIHVTVIISNKKDAYITCCHSHIMYNQLMKLIAMKRLMALRIQ